MRNPRWYLFALLAATVLAAAAPSAGAPGRGRVGIYLGDGMPGERMAPQVGVLAQRLKQGGFEVTRLTAADMAVARTFVPGELRVLVADLTRLPKESVVMLLEWMRRGGVLVSVSAPAFQEFYVREGERLIPQDEQVERRLEALAKGARNVILWSPEELAPWNHVNGPAPKPAVATVVVPKGAPDGSNAVALTIPHFSGGWWSWGRQFSAPIGGAEDELLCFWARGDANTALVSVELTERDGSRWVAVVPLREGWRQCVLTTSAFKIWRDPPIPGRGAAGDRVHFERVVGLRFGISNTHTPAVCDAETKQHQITLGPVGVARRGDEPLAQVEPVTIPELEALSPGYKLHEIGKAARWETSALGKAWGLPAKVPAAEAVGAVERPGGQGFDRSRWWRWIPLLQASDPTGKTLGAPLSLVVSRAPSQPHTAWLSLGLRNAASLTEPNLQGALAAAILRMTSEPLLFEAGTAHFLWRPGEKVKVGAQVLGAVGHATQVRFRLLGPGGKDAAPALALPVVAVPKGETATASGAFEPLAAGEYRLVAELLRGGKVLDRIAHPLRVVAPLRRPPAESEIVRRNGGRFVLGGKPWYPIGANYWAHNLGGIPNDLYWGTWLAPELYDPEVVEADLAQMKRWGYTAIAGVGADIRWPAGEDNATLRNLEDFLWRCHAHQLKVFFFCQGLDPRGPNHALAQRLIRAVRHHPALAGYDIAWEPGYGSYRLTCAPQWRAWLEREYGNLQQAERVLGHPLPRNAKGEVDVLPNAWLERDGPWSEVTAAYRAFVNWEAGAGYRQAAALIRELDPVHLIGFRGSMAGHLTNPKPMEQPAVLHFMDFAGPEGYDVPRYGRLTPEPVLAARGMVTRLLEHYSGGKPVVWMEFGLPVYPNGTNWQDSLLFVKPDRLQYQVEEAQRWWQVLGESGAAGGFPWWYAGGFRVGERSDCGLTWPNNQARPVGEAIAREFLPRFLSTRTRTPDTWLELRPEENNGGWVGEYLRLREEYARHTLAGHRVGVRLAKEDGTSADCALTTLRGKPWPGKGPLGRLDAIFERVRVRAGDGAWQEVALPTRPGPVQVSVPRGVPLTIEAWAGNTAQAVWLATPADGVRLAVSGDATVDAPLLERTPFQGSGHFAPVRVAEQVTRPMALRLQLKAGNRAAFGEIVELAVIPQ